MKEVMRIHLAKIAYDIELEAKKELQAYMAELEQYANDTDILQEIELRVTELLDERGVVAGGVISMGDVEAVRTQLGEPRDFADEEATSVEYDVAATTARRLYRDEEEALLGGVLSGVAKYFGMQPIWTRLVFVVLLFVSFGTALVVYVILWIIVPPARSATEKLALEGKPVTLAAIKERGEQIVNSRGAETAGRAVRNVALFCLGLLFAGGAVITLVITIVAGFMLLVGGSDEVGLPFVLAEATSWYYVLSIALFILSGLLLTALNVLLASASFRRSWTRRVSVAVGTIVIAGVTTFAVGFLPLGVGSWYEERAVQQSYKTAQHDLPASFDKVKNLTIEIKGASSIGVPQVTYMARDTLGYEISHPEGSVPELDIEQEGVAAKIVVSMEGESPWGRYYQPTIRLYGPALSEITVKGGALQYNNKTAQDAIMIKTEADTRFTAEGKYREVRATALGGSEIHLDSATVERLFANTQGGSVEAGVIKYLDVTQPTACPAQADDQNSIEVAGVTSGELQMNGEPTSLNDTDAIERPCGVIEVEKLQDY